MDKKFFSNTNELNHNGLTVIRGVFNTQIIEDAREQILNNRYLFKNTRPTLSSLHLPSFHRFPSLESLHVMLTCNPVIKDFIISSLNGHFPRSIGLSDITINRSQNWHTDLLRGKYAHYIQQILCVNKNSCGPYKVLLYLQDGASLKYIQGSHLRTISLEDDNYAKPNEADIVMPVSVLAGDIVIMDIRCAHRGADESTYASGNWDNNPRILISTVLGAADCPLTAAMEIGNFHRLQEWIRIHQ